MTLDNKQRGVLKGILSGAFLTIAVLGAGIAYFPAALTSDAGVDDRLAFTLKADVLVVVWLAVSIGMLARHRFFTPEDIDGAAQSSGSQRAQVLQSKLQNTLEQVVLAILAHMMWAVIMPVSWITGVPAAAMLFFVGRILFIRGYDGGAPARALGFALTFYPSIIMLLLSVVTIVLSLAR
jgi:uncharacterized membrane protein YecN with MAPEG domain